jgi:hypothetical protein
LGVSQDKSGYNNPQCQQILRVLATKTTFIKITLELITTEIVPQHKTVINFETPSNGTYKNKLSRLPQNKG